MTKHFGAVVVALLLLIAGSAAVVTAQSRPPIKIGFTADLTGIAAQPAKDMVNGLTMYLDEIGHQMAGRKVEIADAPRGPVKLDAQGNPIQNVYIRKVERNKDGELQNTVIVTIPAVSQFWKYGPEEFLKQPVYSRDFPPCRAC
jgi:hypothetical protein